MEIYDNEKMKYCRQVEEIVKKHETELNNLLVILGFPMIIKCEE